MILLAIRKGVPARASTFKSSPTRASRASCFSTRNKMRRVLPTTAKGVTPSGSKTCWDDFSMVAPIGQARDDLVMLVSAPVSRVSRMG